LGTSGAVTDIRVRRKKAAVNMSTFTRTSMPTVPLTTVATHCRLGAHHGASRRGQSLDASTRQWSGNGARGQPTWPVVRVGLSKPNVTWQVDSPSHRHWILAAVVTAASMIQRLGQCQSPLPVPSRGSWEPSAGHSHPCRFNMLSSSHGAGTTRHAVQARQCKPSCFHLKIS
jgi:hypothetical protein